MKRAKLYQSWAQTATHLQNAKQALSKSMLEEYSINLIQVDELLNHNELGLAADYLTDICIKTPSDALESMEYLLLAERSMGRVREQQQLEKLLSQSKWNHE